MSVVAWGTAVQTGKPFTSVFVLTQTPCPPMEVLRTGGTSEGVLSKYRVGLDLSR